ncbi:CEP104 [Mytilus edulis]|uniref:CEP104 n=1 Tax=Mytilus edulis TaxID=6550 RepID=A0A8S3RJI5_MYTED|nr:CEP104 [Mytilus edulis]
MYPKKSLRFIEFIHRTVIQYCLYPQDIVLQLDQRCRLRKIQILSHQYLIATKIEFFVGDVPEDMSPNLENARYTRLGYVSLSDNEKTGFKARELKSVHVDAVGLYLKLNIHKNHINKYNIYNQVGIIAINVIGETLKGPSDFMDPEYYLDPDRKGQLDDLGLDTYNKPDYISPLDDLAFDMYQDPEIAGIIRKLEKKKQEAVLQERFDYAKRLKSAITELQKVGEKLGKYEVEKRQAVENEDYDKAKLKKVQMDEYRLQVYRDLNLADLLETTGSRHPQVIDLEPIRQATPPRLLELTPRSPIQRSPPRTPPPRTPYDERPLPALKSKDTPRELPSTPPPRTSYDERPLPVKPPAVPDEEPEPAETAVGITGEPEPLTEKDLREASAAIDVFGEQLVSKAYSKTWSYREDALLAVFKAGLHLLKMILTEYVPKHKIQKQDTVWAVERSMQNLLHKSGDTAVRNRDDAKNFVLEMARYPEVKPTNCVPHEAVKPMKNSVAPRLGQSRCEIVEMLYKDLGIKTNSGLNIDNMMQFCVAALSHHAGEVRDGSERIIKALYKEDRQAVKDYLPADDDKTRKITLYRQLFEYFDKVDGKPSKADVRKKRSDEETKKQAEIEALQKQLQSLKDMASGKQDAKTNQSKPSNKPVAKKPVDENLLKADKNKKKNEPPKKSKIINKKPTADDDDTSVYNMDNICIFCGERNESFTEEGLDLHYWKHCPMLKRCTNCKQVVEIATYTDHLLNECEAKNNYSKCNRCTEAIPKSEYDQHVSEKSCNAAKSSSNHCPLCHQNVSSGEDGWKNHLMGKDGCKQNPRRLLSLNKNPSTGGTSKNKPKATGKNKKTPR